MVGFRFFCSFMLAHRVSHLFRSALLPITLHITLAAFVCSSLVGSSSSIKSSMVHCTLAFSIVPDTRRDNKLVLSHMFFGSSMLCVSDSDDGTV